MLEFLAGYLRNFLETSLGPELSWSLEIELDWSVDLCRSGQCRQAENLMGRSFQCLHLDRGQVTGVQQLDWTGRLPGWEAEPVLLISGRAVYFHSQPVLSSPLVVGVCQGER